MKKHQATIAGILAVALLSMLAVSFVFFPKIQIEEEKMGRSERILKEHRDLLARKTQLESEWQSKRNIFTNQSPQEVLNAWLKDLLNYAQAQSFTLDKLEPAGIKEGLSGKDAVVFVSFQGDIKKFNMFLNHLMEIDPLSRIQSFSVSQAESSKNLSFELMLAKAVS